MKRFVRYALPLLLTMMGGALLIVGLLQDRSAPMLIGACLALAAGLAAFALQAGVISRKVGAVIGIVLLVAAAILAWHNFTTKRATTIGSLLMPTVHVDAHFNRRG